MSPGTLKSLDFKHGCSPFLPHPHPIEMVTLTHFPSPSGRGQRVRENGPHPPPFSRREKGARRGRLRAISFTLAGVRAKQRKNGPHPVLLPRGEGTRGLSGCALFIVLLSNPCRSRPTFRNGCGTKSPTHLSPPPHLVPALRVDP